MGNDKKQKGWRLMVREDTIEKLTDELCEQLGVQATLSDFATRSLVERYLDMAYQCAVESKSPNVRSSGLQGFRFSAAAKDGDCACCKQPVLKGVQRWIKHETIICAVCVKEWEVVGGRLCDIPRFRKDYL